MGGKGKKKGKSKKQATEAVDEEAGENGEGNGSAKKGKGKGKKGKAGKSSKFQGDILSDAAMENAYYVCHNLMDVLKVNTRKLPMFVSVELIGPLSRCRHVALLGLNRKRRRRRARSSQLFETISILHCNLHVCASQTCYHHPPQANELVSIPLKAFK